MKMHLLNINKIEEPKKMWGMGICNIGKMNTSFWENKFGHLFMTRKDLIENRGVKTQKYGHKKELGAFKKTTQDSWLQKKY